MDPKEKTSESKIIAQIDIHLPTDYREQFLEDYNHCPLCGTELMFTHSTHFINGITTEEATCNACNIQTKKSDHCLQ